MSLYDLKYAELCDNIIDFGWSDKGEKIRPRWEDGTPAHTKSILNYQLKFDNVSREVPILTTKYVAWKWAIKELLWIWQLKSNDVRVLNDMGVNIWDEWKRDDHTIGKAYGYQLGEKCLTIKESIQNIRRIPFKGNETTSNGKYVFAKVDQVDYLLHQLKYNPSSRRHITTLWDKDDIEDMALTPCVWNTHWQVQDNKLHLTVGIRSNDVALGQPFNVFQYYVLQRMIAQVTSYKMGTLTFNIDNAHLYIEHIPTIQDHLMNEPQVAPALWINPNVTNFYDFTIDDFKLEGYEHGGRYNMEVAI